MLLGVSGAQWSAVPPQFEIIAEDGVARTGVLHTGHGDLHTPAFFGVATRAALKGVEPAAAREAGLEAVICNSYHLALQPGAEAVARAGGLHRFMGWPGVMATDSGGFQIFSLRFGQVADEIKGRRRLPAPARGSAGIAPADAVHLTEEGALFRSYLDGSTHLFTPESNMELQQALGADLLFCLDECTPLHVPREYTERATERNLRWARRCLDRHREVGASDRQGLFGIVHGGVYPDLRERAARAIGAMDFFGFAIGDCLGETKEDWYRVVDRVRPFLPGDRPRHLLGVGEPDDLVEGALRGMDSFDCAMPTRIARHGQALAFGRPRYRLHVGSAACRYDEAPIEEGCPCTACSRHSRAYLHHLTKARELLGVTLLAEHNLCFTSRLLERVRAAIACHSLADLRAEVLCSR
ncbi:MAG: tRNA guanosine(34) transglycosylase Tgt [Candidatus Dormibacteraeota bacterium]|nr:tRNA guanosine(34) transglycosylase Tgt [Candidatus Dormibacteraeota bacterium]